MTTENSVDKGTISVRRRYPLRRGGLGVLGITFLAISAVAPLAAMAGGASVAMLFGVGSGVPGAYIVVTIALVVFSIGYATMARHGANSGALYSYVCRGLRQQFGVAAAYLALLSYNAIQIALWGLFGSAVTEFLTNELDVYVNWWVFALLGIACVAVLGYRRIVLSVKVAFLLVAAQFLAIVVLAIVIALKGGDFGTTSLSIAPLTPSALTAGSLPVTAIFCFASFVGFESVTVYSEETKDPASTVPRAIFLSVLIIGAVYSLVTFLMVNGAGATQVEGVIGRLSAPTTFLFELFNSYIDPRLTIVVRILFITSVFSAALAFHNVVARHTYSLGRDGLLPAWTGRVHSSHSSPHMGSVAQSVIAGVVVVLFALVGLDPKFALYAWLMNLGVLGVIALMATTSFAIAAFFLRRRGVEKNMWRSVIAPLLSGVALTVVLIYGIVNTRVLVDSVGGGGSGGVVGWLLPGLLIVAAALGVVISLVLKSRAPQLYADLGCDRR
ncbi:MAG: APC family permease [Gordonia sp. (in: high G+C Gram-positive bacteria)]